MSNTTDQTTLEFEGVERQPLRTFAERAYLEYSMYVILDRALPHVGDGLKPVQRRSRAARAGCRKSSLAWRTAGASTSW